MECCVTDNSNKNAKLPTVREDDDVCNVAATVNHSLAFTVSYGIARSALSDDAPASKNLLCIHVQCLSLSPF